MRRLPLLLLALAACNTGFEPQYLVKDLRILAVRSHVDGSDPRLPVADAMPGETLVLEALVANPLGRAVTVSWYGCAPRADETLPPCADPVFLRDPARLATAPGVLPLGTGERVSVPVPDVAAALQFVEEIALQEPAFQCRLYAEMPVVAIVEGDGRRQLAVKRVRLTPDPATLPPELAGAYAVNHNPQDAPGVLDIVRAPADDCPHDRVAVGAGPFPRGNLFLCGVYQGLVDGYYRCGPAGEREITSEALEWQWYATGGEFPEFDGVGNATGSSVEFVRPGEPFTLWAILRDGRGGETWARRDFAAAP